MTDPDDVIGGGLQLQLLTAEEARALTGRIVDKLSDAWADVVEAYRRRADRALGYDSWDAYCSAEFASVRLRLPAEDRAIAVRSLRAEGLSTRAIAAATGQSQTQVRRDAAVPSPAGEPYGSPAPPITGQDGKSYAPTRPAARPADPPPTPEPPPETQLVPEPPLPETPTNAELDAQLDAAMDGTAVRFRRNFTAVMARADDVGEFDLDRAAEVMDHNSLNRYIGFWRRWCDQLEDRMRARTRAGLRVVGGDR